MDGKPLHYDGSVMNFEGVSSSSELNSFQITDEMRKNIGGNPYEINKNT